MSAFLLRLYPSLSALIQSEKFVSALADDHWLELKKPFLEIPDLVSGERTHWEKLITAVPEVVPFGNMADEAESIPAQRYMTEVRRAAIRTLAVAAEIGTQTFLPTPSFGGDPTIRLSLKSGLNCRIGRANDVAWKPTPSAVSRLLQILNDSLLLKAVEVALFPLAAAAHDNEQLYAKHFATWSLLAPLRHIDGTSRASLVGPSEALNAIPGGYVERYTADDIAATTVPISVAAKIASPYANSAIHQIRLTDEDATAVPSADLLDWGLKRCA